jgi:FkbM family methyltransferase
MRKEIRILLNQFFVRYPAAGHWGYRLIRAARLSRGTRHTRAFLKGIEARGFKPRNILDVGANNAEWSWIAHSVFPQANYFLIEPLSEMKPFLDRFCARNLEAKWFQAGAGAEAGELTFTIWDDYVGSSFLPEPSHTLKESGKQRTVPIITIDSLIAAGHIPIPDLIKIDVQGFEREVLKGGSRSLGQVQMLIVECSLYSSTSRKAPLHDVISFLQEYGYVIYDLLDLKYRPSDGALGQVDICFVNEDGPLRAMTRWY